SVELVLPIPITAEQAAGWATATDIEPAHVLTVSVERHADGDLKGLPAASACALLQLGPLEVIGAVPDGVFVAAGNARADSRSFTIVQGQVEVPASALTPGVGEMVDRVPVFLAVAEQLGPDVGLFAAVPVLPASGQAHHRSSKRPSDVFANHHQTALARLL